MTTHPDTIKEMILDALVIAGRIAQDNRGAYSGWSAMSRMYADGGDYELGLKHPIRPSRIFLRNEKPSERELNDRLYRQIFTEFPDDYKRLTSDNRVDRTIEINPVLAKELEEVLSWERD